MPGDDEEELTGDALPGGEELGVELLLHVESDLSGRLVLLDVSDDGDGQVDHVLAHLAELNLDFLVRHQFILMEAEA